MTDYNPDLSKATAQAVDLFVSLAAAEKHPSERDAHINAALRSFLALGPQLAALRKPPVVSNVIPLRVEPVSAFEAWRA